MLHGLARSISLGKEKKEPEVEEQGTVLRTSGTLRGEGSETFAAACSRRGEKGSNQDCSIVWEVSSFVRSTRSCSVSSFCRPLCSLFSFLTTKGIKQFHVLACALKYCIWFLSPLLPNLFSGVLVRCFFQFV